MILLRPSFLDSEYFEITESGWKLNDGASKSVRKEFNDYMKKLEKYAGGK